MSGLRWPSSKREATKTAIQIAQRLLDEYASSGMVEAEHAEGSCPHCNGDGTCIVPTLVLDAVRLLAADLGTP